MGFMDKAKKLAEQAQTKLEDVQKDFNEKQGGSTGAPAGAGSTVEYDDHGRPKAPQTPSTPADLPATGAGELDKAVGDPLSSDTPSAPVAAAPSAEPAEEVRATPSQGDPLLEETERKPAPPSGGGLTSGDPLG